jgi:hypothetical protein
VAFEGGERAPREPEIAVRIAGLVAMAANDEVCRLLGIEGALESQLDLAFVDDPLDWIAYDLAQAIIAVEAEGDDNPGPTLAALVAELRLHRALKGEVDEGALGRLVRDYLKDSAARED